MRQTGCGDGDHWGGQRLAGLTAAQPLVTLKRNKNIYSHSLVHSLNFHLNPSPLLVFCACYFSGSPHREIQAVNNL